MCIRDRYYCVVYEVSVPHLSTWCHNCNDSNQQDLSLLPCSNLHVCVIIFIVNYCQLSFFSFFTHILPLSLCPSQSVFVKCTFCVWTVCVVIGYGYITKGFQREKSITKILQTRDCGKGNKYMLNTDRRGFKTFTQVYTLRSSDIIKSRKANPISF